MTRKYDSLTAINLLGSMDRTSILRWWNIQYPAPCFLCLANLFALRSHISSKRPLHMFTVRSFQRNCFVWFKFSLMLKQNRHLSTHNSNSNNIAPMPCACNIFNPSAMIPIQQDGNHCGSTVRTLVLYARTHFLCAIWFILCFVCFSIIIFKGTQINAWHGIHGALLIARRFTSCYCCCGNLCFYPHTIWMV